MTMTARARRFLAPLFLAATTALGGCATSSFNPDVCTEDTRASFGLFSYNAPTRVDDACRIGRTAALAVAGEKGEKKEDKIPLISYILHQQFLKVLPPEAQEYYKGFLKNMGLSPETLDSPPPAPKPKEDGLNCTQNSRGHDVCTLEKK